MLVARCPVCEDIITVGVVLKLYQPVTCPTCLANLQVVSLSPFELDVSPGGKYHASLRKGSNMNVKKANSNAGPSWKHSTSDYLGGEDEDNYEEYDDYLLERRQRHKSDRDKRRRGVS
jgi:hypothetical protein